MRRVVIESPYAGDVERNLRYLRACMRDCLLLGEAPFASHALYTQAGVLDDSKLHERQQGMAAGLAWGQCADLTVIYKDLGISSGMQLGIDASKAEGRPVEYRTLPEWKEGQHHATQPVTPAPETVDRDRRSTEVKDESPQAP